MRRSVFAGASKQLSVKQEKKKKKKRTALVICRDHKQFRTTQAQFWQWVREGVVVKTQDQPLTGAFQREHEELMIVLSNTVLDLAHPIHLTEALRARADSGFQKSRHTARREAEKQIRRNGFDARA